MTLVVAVLRKRLCCVTAVSLGGGSLRFCRENGGFIFTVRIVKCSAPEVWSELNDLGHAAWRENIDNAAFRPPELYKLVEIAVARRVFAKMEHRVL